MGALRTEPRWWLAGLICLLFSSVAPGADLLEVYERALEADPELRAAALNHEASREILSQAWSDYRPAVTFDYEHRETNQRIHDSENVLFQKGSENFPTDNLTLSLTQPVFRYANYIRIKQAESELKQADARFVQAQQELMLRVAETYLEALAAADHLEFLSAERSALEQQLRIAEGRERAKIGRPSDRLEAEARLAAVNADYAEAELNRDDSHEGIYELIGEVPQTLAKLRTEFPLTRPDPAEPRAWTERALQQNWELEAQKQAVEVARKEIRRQRAGHLPTLDVQLRENFIDQGGTVFGGGSEVETRDLMLNINVPLYLGGSTSSQTREADLKYRSEMENLTRLERKVRREAQRAFKAIVHSIARIEALAKEVAAQEEALRLKRAGFEAAVYSNLAVLDAERDLYSAKRDHAAARYEYLLITLRLKAIVGTLSREDLVTSNSWLVR